MMHLAIFRKNKDFVTSDHKPLSESWYLSVWITLLVYVQTVEYFLNSASVLSNDWW